MLTDEAFAIYPIEVIVGPVVRPMLTHAGIRQKALANIDSADIGRFLEDIEIAEGNSVMRKRYPVMELLPACADCSVQAVTNLDIDEIL